MNYFAEQSIMRISDMNLIHLKKSRKRQLIYLIYLFILMARPNNLKNCQTIINILISFNSNSRQIEIELPYLSNLFFGEKYSGLK